MPAFCRWVEEYHVDGFRFDLASCLCRDSSGTPLEVPPIIRDIAKDPVLSKVTANTGILQNAAHEMLSLMLPTKCCQYCIGLTILHLRPHNPVQKGAKVA